MTLIGIGKQTLSLGADIEGEEHGVQHILIALPPGTAREISLSKVLLMHDCGHALNKTVKGGETILQCKSCKREVRLPANIKTVGELLTHKVKESRYPLERLGCIS